MSWLLMTSGRGPAECQRFVQLLVHEISREATQSGLSCELLEKCVGLLQTSGEKGLDYRTIFLPGSAG